MDFNQYQTKALSTDVYSNDDNVSVMDPAFMAKILGLVGESGEVAEKFKKIIRDKNGEITDEDKKEIVKELGDVLWYCATISRYLGKDFEEVAQANIDKLADRHKRGVISSKGDNR